MYRQQIELDMPFRVDAQGRIAFTSDPQRQLRNRVIAIIGTEIGERVMRPGYGTTLQSLMFEGDYDDTATIIESDIRAALERHEPGVIVREVFTTTIDASGETIRSRNNELDGVVSLNVTYSAVNSPLETVQIPVNTATLYRGGVVEEERSG